MLYHTILYHSTLHYTKLYHEADVFDRPFEPRLQAPCVHYRAMIKPSAHSVCDETFDAAN